MSQEGTCVASVDLSVLRRVAPEWLEVVQRRARILQRIRMTQPIGRRLLAADLGMTERVLRAEVDLLRRQGLVQAHATGMWLSDEGQALLEELDQALALMEGREQLGRALSASLGIPEVVVVAGDSDADGWAKDSLGYYAAVRLRNLLRDDDVLAVTGGTTLAAVAQMMPGQGGPRPVRVVPARGGLGENMTLQANTIASAIAAKLGGQSIMLHVPDRLSEDTLERLMAEPEIRERLDEVRQATVVVHGIGDAMKMARRRQLSETEVALLCERGAVSEAFGYYFDREGRPVYAMTTVGLRLDDIAGARVVMAVAGGASKSLAIRSAARAYRIDVLVTDEGAAKGLVAAATAGTAPAAAGQAADTGHRNHQGRENRI
ncbi:MAG: DNA-binding transcriptional regulator [Alicyclobacillaceae bacterium]|nr:DNA-binding transcriptional regulator [Alicyclobacillaceae bacterium]